VNVRGFSLIEAMAALAIAAVILSASTGAVMGINRMILDTSRRSAAWDETKRLEEFLVAFAQGAGSGALRPHASIFVENSGGVAPPAIPPSTGGMGCRVIAGIPDCTASGQGADRLTVFQQIAAFPQCPVTDTTGVNINIGAGALACCLNDAGAGLSSWDGQQGLLVGSIGVASVRINSPNDSGSLCKANAPPGQGAGVLPTALAAIGYPGTLVMVTASTFFVDRSTHELKIWSDTDGDGDAGASELTLVHDQVYDLQLAMGFDGLPEEGEVVDANSSTDEFLFNHVSDATMPGNGNFADVVLSQLRLLQISVAVGTPSQVSGGNAVQLLDRASAITATNVYLTQTSGKAYMRNLALFTQ
jgi:prepilin-type N-terminal cleavage/methylation domain-containing protein